VVGCLSAPARAIVLATLDARGLLALSPSLSPRQHDEGDQQLVGLAWDGHLMNPDEELAAFDYANRVTLTVRLQSTLWEVEPSPPTVAWRAELPANTGGPGGPPVDVRRLASAVSTLSEELEEGFGCCGVRPYALETKHSRVEIGPSGGSLDFVMHVAEHASDQTLDYVLGAAGATVLAKIRKLLKGRSDGGPDVTLPRGEATRRAESMLTEHYGVANLQLIGESFQRHPALWELTYTAGDMEYGAAVGAVGDDVVVTKTWGKRAPS